MTQITIREYAKLHRKRKEQTFTNDLNNAYLSVRDFDWLVEQIEASDDKENGWRQLLRFNGRDVLSVRQFVGYIETPNGLGIEIIPKHTADVSESNNEIEKSRKLLQKML